MPTAALVTFLVDRFSEEELRRLTRHHYQRIAGELPGSSASKVQVADRLVELLESRGLVDAHFFELLRRERPRLADIDGLASAHQVVTRPRTALGPLSTIAPPIPSSSSFGATSHRAPGASPTPGPSTPTSAAEQSASASTTEQVLTAWVHVSDIHFGHGQSGHQLDQQLITADILRDLADVLRGGALPLPRHVFVTGDVAFSGGGRRPVAGGSEYELAAAWLDRLVAVLGLGREQVFLVPGNHDVDRAVDQDRDVRRLLQLARAGTEPLDEILQHDGEVGRLRQRMAAFLEFARSFGPSGREMFHGGLWWRHRVALADGVRLRICGFNTALLSAADDDQGKLAVSGRQLAELVLPSPDELELVVALSHHPFTGSWIADEAAARGRLDREAAIHLFGHLHNPDSEQARHGWGTGCLRLAAGATHAEAMKSGEPATGHGYSLGALVALPSGELVVRIWPRRWSGKATRFVLDVDNVVEGKGYAEHRLRQRIRRLGQLQLQWETFVPPRRRGERFAPSPLAHWWRALMEAAIGLGLDYSRAYADKERWFTPRNEGIRQVLAAALTTPSESSLIRDSLRGPSIEVSFAGRAIRPLRESSGVEGRLHYVAGAEKENAHPGEHRLRVVVLLERGPALEADADPAALLAEAFRTAVAVFERLSGLSLSDTGTSQPEIDARPHGLPSESALHDPRERPLGSENEADVDHESGLAITPAMAPVSVSGSTGAPTLASDEREAAPMVHSVGQRASISPIWSILSSRAVAYAFAATLVAIFFALAFLQWGPSGESTHRQSGEGEQRQGGEGEQGGDGEHGQGGVREARIVEAQIVFDGVPVESARLKIAALNVEVTTDADGRFTVELPDDKTIYGAEVTLPGRPMIYRSIAFVGERPIISISPADLIRDLPCDGVIEIADGEMLRLEQPPPRCVERLTMGNNSRIELGPEIGEVELTAREAAFGYGATIVARREPPGERPPAPAPRPPAGKCNQGQPGASATTPGFDGQPGANIHIVAALRSLGTLTIDASGGNGGTGARGGNGGPGGGADISSNCRGGDGGPGGDGSQGGRGGNGGRVVLEYIFIDEPEKNIPKGALTIITDGGEGGRGGEAGAGGGGGPGAEQKLWVEVKKGGGQPGGNGNAGQPGQPGQPGQSTFQVFAPEIRN